MSKDFIGENDGLDIEIIYEFNQKKYSHDLLYSFNISSSSGWVLPTTTSECSGGPRSTWIISDNDEETIF